MNCTSRRFLYSVVAIVGALIPAAQTSAVCQRACDSTVYLTEMVGPTANDLDGVLATSDSLGFCQGLMVSKSAMGLKGRGPETPREWKLLDNTGPGSCTAECYSAMIDNKKHLGRVECSATVTTTGNVKTAKCYLCVPPAVPPDGGGGNPPAPE